MTCLKLATLPRDVARPLGALASLIVLCAVCIALVSGPTSLQDPFKAQPFRKSVRRGFYWCCHHIS